MSIVEWLETYFAKKQSDPKIILRRTIYQLAGGKEKHEFYGCNGEHKDGGPCPQNYKGIGLHFIITSSKGKNAADDLYGFEDQELAENLIKKLLNDEKTDLIVLCRWCYVDH